MRALTLAALLGVSAPSVAAPPKPRIEVQGHRGARALRPENTLPAFEYAIREGVDVLELDLVVTKDDRLVVTHDPHVSPVLCTKDKGAPVPEGLAVRALRFAELRKLDCGAKRNPRFPRQVTIPGTRIPSFEEVLDLVLRQKRRVDLNVEIKIEPAHPELFPSPERFAALVVGALKKHGLLERVTIQSFDARALVAVRARAPEARLSMLISDNAPPLVPIAKALGARVISPHHEWITADAVAELHRAKVRVVPWTANDPAAWARLVDLGVDGIITDDPAALIRFLAQRGLR